MFIVYNGTIFFKGWLGIKKNIQRQIVVSSDERKLGKTLLVCELIEKFNSIGLSVSCIKLSRGTYGLRSGIQIDRGTEGSDTDRYSKAGASRVVLFRYSQIQELVEAIDEISSDADIQIWESNSILKLRKPDYHIHLISDSNRKPSATGLFLEADLTANGPMNVMEAKKISSIVPVLMNIRDMSSLSINGKHWIELDGESLFGQGRIELLKAVRSTGSILQAASETGVPYKRAWLLLRDAEDRLGAKLITSDRGGSKGGGSSLTKLAEKIIEIWNRTESDFRDLLNQLEV